MTKRISNILLFGVTLMSLSACVFNFDPVESEFEDGFDEFKGTIAFIADDEIFLTDAASKAPRYRQLSFDGEQKKSLCVNTRFAQVMFLNGDGSPKYYNFNGELVRDLSDAFTNLRQAGWMPSAEENPYFLLENDDVFFLKPDVMVPEIVYPDADNQHFLEDYTISSFSDIAYVVNTSINSSIRYSLWVRFSDPQREDLKLNFKNSEILSPDWTIGGRNLLFSVKNRLFLWSLDNGPSLRIIENSSKLFAISPRGTEFLYVDETTNRIVIQSLQDPGTRKELPVVSGTITHVDWD